MDPLTHSLFGLTLARTGLNRLTPSAAPIALLASNLADLDSVFQPWGDIRHLVWHRHFTHSFAFTPVIAFLAVAIVHWLLRRPVRWRGAMILAWACSVGHVALDLLTIWKVRAGLPFSGNAISLQSQWMIDPVLLILLGLALAIPFLSNLVSGEIGARKGSGQATAVVCLVLVAGWFLLRAQLHQTVVEELRSRVYEGAVPTRVEAWPTMHPLRFTGYAETEKAIYVLPVSLLEFVDPEAAQAYFKPVYSAESGRAARMAGLDEKVQIFLSWAQWPRWQVFRYEGPEPWVVIVEELGAENNQTRPRVIVKLDANYRILSSTYEAARSAKSL
jgi:membrane-bound metal-dependent hydrolase YbcI (DUF457 family)